MNNNQIPTAYYLLLFVSSFIVIVSCNTNDIKEVIINEQYLLGEEYMLKELQDISLYFDDNKNKMKGIKYFFHDEKEYYVFYNPVKQAIEFNTIHTNQLEYSVQLQVLDSMYNIENGLSFFVHKPDSIFVLITNINTIYLIQGNGEIADFWNVDVELENNNNDYVLQHLPNIPLCFSNNKIYIMSVRTDIAVNNPEGRKIYFSTPPDVIIDISKQPNKITNKTCEWPDIYLSEENYDDYWPDRCMNDKNQVIYGFAVDHSLKVYSNDTLIKTIEAKSKYFTQFTPYPADSIGNFSFKKRYWTTEPRYLKIIYDPYRNLYYRLYHHVIEYEKKGGMFVHDYEDKPWSVIILNQDFEVTDEVLFDPTVYTPYHFIPTEKGILISKRKKREDEKINDINFTLFKLESNGNKDSTTIRAM